MSEVKDVRNKMNHEKNNFWQNLDKNFLALAPMAGVTDLPFRLICQQFGADVVYSEMASATALFYDLNKRKSLDDSPTLELLKTIPEEKNYVVQLFGSNPEHFAVATRILSQKGIPRSQVSDTWDRPAGIDINFGCPVKKVQKQGAGAVLMADKKLSREVIKAVIDNTDLPVSIKTRTKVREVELLDFLDSINDLDIKALMIHGRTLSQMFSGPIDTDIIKNARNYFGGVIIANGGIMNYQEAKNLLAKTQAEGIGLARGAMGRPWLFKEVTAGEIIDFKRNNLIALIKKHAKLVDMHLDRRGIVEFRKHLLWYVKGSPGARHLRQSLMTVSSLSEVDCILDKIR